ncbi:MAG TPA: hypothetical protein VHN58_01155 [Croceicoccus sp.]|nr:hypothetical protein [Croceicoccus sp.]
MTRPSPLDDPKNAAHAWARYRRLMKWMFALTSTTVAISLAILYWRNGLVSIHLYIATALGVTAAMMLMAALMGLVFLSSGTGHDEAVDDRFDEEAKNAWDQID